jgi:hypothetical protein
MKTGQGTTSQLAEKLVGRSGCGKNPVVHENASGHGFSRAVNASKRVGFSPCVIAGPKIAFFRSLFSNPPGTHP